MAINEALELNGIELNSLAGTFSLEALDLTPPAKKPEWAQNSDADGSDLIRTPLFENRTVTANIRVNPQVSMNVALEKIGELVDQLQEAEKNPNGIALKWTPANSTKTITFFVLTGAVTGLPIMVEGTPGWFQAAPLLVVSMICKPFGYGAEVEGAAAKSIETGLSVVVLTVPTVTGDVPAEGRLVVKDTATVGRRTVEWGIQNRYYDAATALILDNEQMTAIGGVGKATLTGAYKPGAGNAVISTTLLGEPTICANTGILKHVGTFRVKARVQVDFAANPPGVTENVKVRLAYQDGEGPFRAGEWQSPVVAGKLVEVDLGTVTLTPAVTGTQKWLGQVEAYSANTGTPDTLHLDYLVFIPILEGYGKARGVQSSQPGTVAAFDAFTTGTLSGTLGARTATVGGAWAAVGTPTDWTVETGQVKKTTTSDGEPRFDTFGATQTNSRIVVTGVFEASAASPDITAGAILRWTNKENYLFAQIRLTPTGKLIGTLGVKVANVTTVLNESNLLNGKTTFAHYTINLVATADGAVTALLTTDHGTGQLSATSSVVATGGALATGTGGIYDRNAASAATARAISSVTIQQLATVPYCIQPGRSLEVRSDSTVAQHPSENYWGNVPVYRGSRFYVPQKGSAGRTSRIIVKADRNDLEVADEQTIADAFTAQCFVTPRYHVCPR